jgi:hypothetical protein
LPADFDPDVAGAQPITQRQQGGGFPNAALGAASVGSADSGQDFRDCRLLILLAAASCWTKDHLPHATPRPLASEVCHQKCRIRSKA